MLFFIVLLVVGLGVWVGMWWKRHRAAPGGVRAACAASVGDGLRRIRHGASGLASYLATTTVPTPTINDFGTFVGAVLNVIIGAAILGIIGLLVIVGFGEFAEFLRGTALTPDAQLVVEVGVAIIALAAIVAVVIMMLRSGPLVWRMNLVRVLAIVLLAAVGVAVRPIGIIRAFGSGFSWWGGEKTEHVGTTLDTILPAPAELTADEAAMRAQAIIEAYQFYLTAGAGGIINTIARVRDPQWQPFVNQYARAAGFDPIRIEAVIAVESAGNPDVTSNTDQKEALQARGLMQLIDGNARTYGRACGIVRTGSYGDSYVPEKNICAGVAYLRMLVAKYGDWELAFTGYNWGEWNLDERGIANFSPTHEHPQPTFWGLLAQNLLVNTLHPGETAQYVPRVLAWEYILRYYDAHGRLPPWNGHPIDVPGPLIAGGGTPVAPVYGGGVSGGIVIIIDDDGDTTPEQPQSNVWYTARSGDTFGGVVGFLLHEDMETALALNPDIAERGLQLQPGVRVQLPESRYAFHRASGNETFRDIASRYRMTTAELLRWSGAWSDEQLWQAGRRDCPTMGCDDERVVASAGAPFLVRK